MSIWKDTLRYKNIVYTRTYKCASTYTYNLLKTLGFENINIKDVNKEDKMFTFIQDPYVRRVKGLAEAIFSVKYETKLAEKDFVTFIKNATVLDQHTIPYSAQYRDYMNRILFLPIDSEKITLNELLVKFFEVHSPELNDIEHTEGLNKNEADIMTHYNGRIKKIKTRAYQFIKKFATNNELSDLVLADDHAIWTTSKKIVETDLTTYLTSKYQ
jgi:hypothetical protein